MKHDLALYIHYPYCKKKCPYCDFNSHVTDKVNYEAFSKAYQTELSYFAAKLPNHQISSIFFGGGTPSLMPIGLVEDILEAAQKNYSLAPDIEITLEANPTSVEVEKFTQLKAIGINRISIGMQSLNDTSLKFLGREHSAKEACKAIEAADRIFSNYSFDLIYGLPEQTLQDWQLELEEALKLAKHHISLYQLTIEKGTQFYSDFRQNKWQLPSEEALSDMYDLTIAMAGKKGFEAYEISNFAQKDKESQHNLSYWQSEDYLGIGAGAHSRVHFAGEPERRALMNIHQPDNWLKSITEKDHALQENRLTDRQGKFDEFVLMGLRTKYGLTKQNAQRLFAKDLEDLFDREKLGWLIDEKMIEFTDNHLIIQPQYRKVTDAIIAKILS
jgi:oxygen-independent coproporphyrinogen-3 oxidase